MQQRYLFASLVTTLLISISTVQAAVYNVGPGKDYATIQAAVDAVAATDTATGGGDNTSARDKEIRIFPGTYTENVSIPADPAGSSWNTANDGWTIRADQRGTVTVNGGFSMGAGRDSFVFDGIDIMVQNGSHGVAMFGGTNRFNMFKNMVIDGQYSTDSWASGLNGHNGYGQNSADHVTIVNMPAKAIYGTYKVGWYISNSILANNEVGIGQEGDWIGSNHTNNFGNTTNCIGSCNDWDSASGPYNNISQDPGFVSTDPSDPGYLFLSDSSPSAGTGNSAGLATAPHAWENRGPGTYMGITHNNMGARPLYSVVPEPASFVLLAAGTLLGLRRRR